MTIDKAIDWLSWILIAIFVPVILGAYIVGVVRAQ